MKDGKTEARVGAGAPRHANSLQCGRRGGKGGLREGTGEIRAKLAAVRVLVCKQGWRLPLGHSSMVVDLFTKREAVLVLKGYAFLRICPFLPSCPLYCHTVAD